MSLKFEQEEVLKELSLEIMLTFMEWQNYIYFSCHDICTSIDGIDDYDIWKYRDTYRCFVVFYGAVDACYTKIRICAFRKDDLWDICKFIQFTHDPAHKIGSNRNIIRDARKVISDWAKYYDK